MQSERVWRVQKGVARLGRRLGSENGGGRRKERLESCRKFAYGVRSEAAVVRKTLEGSRMERRMEMEAEDLKTRMKPAWWILWFGVPRVKY